MQIFNCLSNTKIVSNRFTCFINYCVSIHHKHEIVSQNETISFQKVKRFASCNSIINQLITKHVKRFETQLKRLNAQCLEGFTRFYCLKISFHSNN